MSRQNNEHIAEAPTPITAFFSIGSFNSVTHLYSSVQSDINVSLCLYLYTAHISMLHSYLRTYLDRSEAFVRLVGSGFTNILTYLLTFIFGSSCYYTDCKTFLSRVRRSDRTRVLRSTNTVYKEHIILNSPKRQSDLVARELTGA